MNPKTATSSLIINILTDDNISCIHTDKYIGSVFIPKKCNNDVSGHIQSILTRQINKQLSIIDNNVEDFEWIFKISSNTMYDKFLIKVFKHCSQKMYHAAVCLYVLINNLQIYQLNVNNEIQYDEIKYTE